MTLIHRPPSSHSIGNLKWSSRSTQESTDENEDDTVFPVMVAENEQAVNCRLSGSYELSITSNDISLRHTSNKQRLYTWPYRHIRRYGRTSKNFQFEAGRKCLSGPGLFSLITEDGVGEQIFTQVTKRFEEIRHQLASVSPSSSLDEPDLSSDDEAACPELPPRNYRQDTLRSLFGRRQKKQTNYSKLTELQTDNIPKAKPPKAKAKPSRVKSTPPSTHYEEVDIDNVKVTQQQQTTRSPSFLNTFIQRHKKGLSQSAASASPSTSHSTSPSTSPTRSNYETVKDENFYHVLCDDYTPQIAAEQNYSHVGNPVRK